jgi:hypothetical protein
MSTALLTLPLRHAPTPPSTSKWTKTGPSVDYYMLANTNMLLFNLLLHGMAPFKMEEQARAAAGGGQANEEDNEEVDWRQVAGKRLPHR